MTRASHSLSLITLGLSLSAAQLFAAPQAPVAAQEAPAQAAADAQDPLSVFEPSPSAVEAPEAPTYVAPKQAQFEVLSVELSTPLDGRRLSAERVLTLSLRGEGRLMESFWRAKRLSLYREVVIPSPVEGVPPGVRLEEIGFARIESVSGNILQAKVETDALLKPSAPKTEESLAVMIGDSAKLFVEPEPPPPPKPKPRRKRKPKSPFVREEMKWRL